MPVVLTAAIGVVVVASYTKSNYPCRRFEKTEACNIFQHVYTLFILKLSLVCGVFPHIVFSPKLNARKPALESRLPRI